MGNKPDNKDKSSRNRGSIFDEIISIPTLVALMSVYMIFLITYWAPEMKSWGIPAPIFIIPIALFTIVIPIYLNWLFDTKGRRR